METGRTALDPLRVQSVNILPIRNGNQGLGALRVLLSLVNILPIRIWKLEKFLIDIVNNHVLASYL